MLDGDTQHACIADNKCEVRDIAVTGIRLPGLWRRGSLLLAHVTIDGHDNDNVTNVFFLDHDDSDVVNDLYMSVTATVFDGRAFAAAGAALFPVSLVGQPAQALRR